MNSKILNRFNELEKEMNSVGIQRARFGNIVNSEGWGLWSNAVLNLLEIAFGSNSSYYKNFFSIYKNFRFNEEEFNVAKGLFQSAKKDYENGFYISLEKQVSGELFGDFVALAKTALSEGNKDVAAVLSSAALEDALKRYASLNKIEIENKTMEEVVNALKSQGLVSGAQKTLLSTMSKLRNFAMHANWSKLASEDVSGIIGFVEQFLLSKFSS